MSAQNIQSPFPVFLDTDGTPLNDGYLYIGTTNLNPETNPISVYWDSALTIPAAQPVRTTGGFPSRNGTPARLYANGDFSCTVKTKKGTLVYYAPTNADRTSAAFISADDGAGGTLFTTVQGFITKLLSSTGSSLVGFIQSGANAVMRSVLSKLRDEASAMDYGAKGDGVTDDYAAIMAALSAHNTVVLPDPSVGYLIRSMIVVPANKRLVGANWRTTKILKGYNGDMVELLDGSGLKDVYLEGQSGSWTGQGVIIRGTNGRQKVENLQVKNTLGACINFTDATAGSQFFGLNLDLYRTGSTTTSDLYAITISPTQMLSAIPRKFVNLETNGGCAIDFGGCNDVMVSNGFLGDIKYTADSRGVLVSNCRIANQPALLIKGHNNTINNCDINPQITLDVGVDNISLQTNSYNHLPIIDNSGNCRNMIDHWRLAYTPTLTSGGVAPSLGNGTLSASYSRDGATTTIMGELVIGTTTSLGTGGLNISLPQAKQTGDVVVGGVVYMNRGGTVYEGFMQIAGNASVASFLRDTTGSVTFNSPAVFAAGDFMRWSFTYPN